MKVTKGGACDWQSQLDVADSAVRAAADAIKGQFSHRYINAYKGRHDVQLNADLTAQKVIVELLRAEFPDYGIVAEEDDFARWPSTRLLWAVDPLDGTNNFGYGIAHCALAVTLFEEESVVLAVVHDPLGGRMFSNAVGDSPPRRPPSRQPSRDIPLSRATLSLVTGYAEESRTWGNRFSEWMSSGCKRVVNLWAPALDLALVARGTIDAMVCHGAALLDVCGGMFLVESAGGKVVAFDGTPLPPRRSLHEQPVSFIAARSSALVEELVVAVRALESGQPIHPIARALDRSLRA